MSTVWQEAKDPKSGKSYWYNKQTKETTWKDPNAAGATAPAAPAPAAAATSSDDPEAVAANWAESKDPKSGKPYYYNKVTKKTSWARPACMAAAAEAATTSPSSAGPPALPATAAATPATAAPSAAGAWQEAKDPNSGRSYWYNKQTKETTWKDPNAAAAGAAATTTPPPAAAAAAAPAAASASSVSSAAAGMKKMNMKALADDEDDDGEDVVPLQGRDAASPSGSSAAAAAASSSSADNSKEQSADVSNLLRDENSDDEDGGSGAAGGAERKKLSEEDGMDGSVYKLAKHRHGFFARVFRTGDVMGEDKLLSFKKSLIKKAMLKQNRELDDEAVQTFKNIMSYMGDRKSSKPPLEHAKKMLRNLMIAPSGLRDEAFMQLCKQTTNNPNADSTTRGWELMNFFLATFPPSKNLKSFLLAHFDKAVGESAASPRVASLARLCKERLPTILALGQRKQVPSTLELQCLQESKPIPIKVSLVNGASKTLAIDPYVLISDVEKQMHERFNVSYKAPFALYEQAGINEERILDPSERLLDVMSAWENGPLVEEIKVDKKAEKAKIYEKAPDQIKKLEKKEIKYDKFIYKAKLVLKTSNPDLLADPEAVNLIYLQATADVVSERYPCAEKDITVLAALQLQATFGDYRKDQHVPGWLKPKITEFMPARLLDKTASKSSSSASVLAGKAPVLSDSLVAEWEQKILSKYMKVSGFTALEAKLNYLDYVQEWVFYGATFFTVEQRQFKDYPSPLTLGINCEGVLLMHPEKRTVLENYAYTDVVTWGNSDEKLIVVVGNIVQQRKLIFKTADGKPINQLIHSYVKVRNASAHHITYHRPSPRCPLSRALPVPLHSLFSCLLFVLNLRI
jgi:hypothetical protein